MNFKRNVLETGEVKDEFLFELNKLRDKQKQFSISEFTSKLQDLFLIDKRLPITSKYKAFLGGFILGEGSLNLSLKRKNTVNFGVTLDLEFSVTQSFYGVSHLINLLSVFHTGSFFKKSGSNGTFVFKISNRRAIFEKVFPFWEEYVLPYQTSFEANERFLKFRCLEGFFERKAHLDQEAFINEMLPVWDSLRKQKGQGNESFPDLLSAQNFVLKSISKNKKK